jgi:hypothetical protein
MGMATKADENQFFKNPARKKLKHYSDTAQD